LRAPFNQISSVARAPDTCSGAAARGLQILPATQVRYCSIVGCEATPSRQIVGRPADMQAPLDGDGNATIVHVRMEDRPSNATAENGFAWIGRSPRKRGFRQPGRSRRLPHADDPDHGARP
jgi:hypothetical protein